MRAFDAPATDPCPTLAENTAYFVLIERVTFTSDFISVWETESAVGVFAGAAGWLIANDKHYFATSTQLWTTAAAPMLIEVSGAAVPVSDPYPAANSSIEIWIGGQRLGTGTSPRVGQLLTSNVVETDIDPNNLPVFTHEWLSLRPEGAILVGSAKSYTVQMADIGYELRIRARYIDSGGTLEDVVSVSTATVLDPDANGAGRIEFAIPSPGSGVFENLGSSNPELGQILRLIVTEVGVFIDYTFQVKAKLPQLKKAGKKGKKS